MAKAAKEAVQLVSTAGSGYFYTFRRNKKKSRGLKKLSLKKYDPIARQHIEFGEKKLSSLKKKFSFERFKSEQNKSNENSGEAS
jgi:large subunit ribosomal protein L33